MGTRAMGHYEWGLSSGCELSYQPLHSQPPQKERKKKEEEDRLHQLVLLNCDTAVLRSFLERLSLISVLEVECLVSVLRVWENGTSRSRLGLESLKKGTSRSHLGLEGWPSRSCDLTSCEHPCEKCKQSWRSLVTDGRVSTYVVSWQHVSQHSIPGHQ